MKPLEPLLMAALAVLAGWMIWVWDYFVGGLPIGYLVLYWLPWTLVLALFLVRGRTKVKAGILAAFLVWLPILHLVEWSSREPFLRDLHRVQAGMTPQEVEAIMEHYIRGTGWPASGLAEGALAATGELRLKGCDVYRHSNRGEFDSDWGIVCFEAGRVANVEFSHD